MSQPVKFFATNSKNTIFLKCRIVGKFGRWKFCIAIFIGIFIYDVYNCLGWHLSHINKLKKLYKGNINGSAQSKKLHSSPSHFYKCMEPHSQRMTKLILESEEALRVCSIVDAKIKTWLEFVYIQNHQVARLKSTPNFSTIHYNTDQICCRYISIMCSSQVH